MLEKASVIGEEKAVESKVNLVWTYFHSEKTAPLLLKVSFLLLVVFLCVNKVNNNIDHTGLS